MAQWWEGVEGQAGTPVPRRALAVLGAAVAAVVVVVVAAVVAVDPMLEAYELVLGDLSLPQLADAG